MQQIDKSDIQDKIEIESAFHIHDTIKNSGKCITMIGFDSLLGVPILHKRPPLSSSWAKEVFLITG